MKPFAVILISIAFMAGTNSVANSQQPFELNNMTCHIRSAETNECTGIPTLQSGILVIAKEGTFTLEARYHGCFMAEQVTQSGRFQVSRFKETTRLELLTTETMGMHDAIADFPRTLGFVHLNNATLDGYWVDVSPVIRGHGRHTEKLTNAELQCEVNE